jgi:hypothetical protein
LKGVSRERDLSQGGLAKDWFSRLSMLLLLTLPLV